jgi:hypothetical protein
MMHELWIGHRSSDSAWDKAVGTVQRLSIVRLLRRLAPQVVHTSNEFYREALEVEGISTGIMPVFGAVPISKDTADAWLPKAVLQKCGLDIAQSRAQFWIFGMFGAVHPNWPAEDLMGRLRDIATRAARRVLIISVGEAGPAAKSMFGRWRKIFPDVTFIEVGRRSPEEVSQFLESVDFCLSSYPVYLLGKSSAAAAMLEHGVPVICSWGDLRPDLSIIGPAFDRLVWRNDGALEERLTRPPPRIRELNRSASVAQQLLHALSDSRDMFAMLQN